MQPAAAPGGPFLTAASARAGDSMSSICKSRIRALDNSKATLHIPTESIPAVLVCCREVSKYSSNHGNSNSKPSRQWMLTVHPGLVAATLFAVSRTPSSHTHTNDEHTRTGALPPSSTAAHTTIIVHCEYLVFQPCDWLATGPHLAWTCLLACLLADSRRPFARRRRPPLRTLHCTPDRLPLPRASSPSSRLQTPSRFRPPNPSIIPSASPPLPPRPPPPHHHRQPLALRNRPSSPIRLVHPPPSALHQQRMSGAVTAPSPQLHCSHTTHKPRYSLRAPN
ncbi:hypothetical protein ANO11243_018700 [Dothideomycetidae sp. 11243]|nr:hypothetical protein ANO11243_018700 [fungal sp. No.11243]